MNFVKIAGQKIEGFVFDVDGTLIDSNESHARAWQLALEEFSIEVAYPSVRRLIGMGGDKLLPHAAQISTESSLGKKIESTRAAIFKKQFLPNLRAFALTNESLQELHRRGFELAIATSASRTDLEGLLKQANIDADVFHNNLVCSDDADESKPNPDILVAACERLKTAPDRLAMVGDTPYDVEAAHRCGMKTIAVRSGGFWNDAEFGEPTRIFDRVSQILEMIG